MAAGFARQGPALASVLFLADAAAAALLAAGAAILGLYLSARRRRYEYAALTASGVHRGTLRRALLSEMALVLSSVSRRDRRRAARRGAGAARPCRVRDHAGLPLSYLPSAAPLVVLLGVAVVLLAAAAGTAGCCWSAASAWTSCGRTPTWQPGARG